MRISIAPTAFALILAIPSAFALATARSARQRFCLQALVIAPLVTMPSIFAYAWLLLATAKNPMLRAMMDALGWNRPSWQPLHAAVVLAAWLWPIPALILATSFRRGGAEAYRLASLDASVFRAFFRGALPVMRAPLMAACAIVFLLAAMDSTVGPLVGASEIWSVEMLARAGLAQGYARPAAFMFWHAWPMIVTVGVLALVAWPGIRQMRSWADDPETGSTTFLPPGPRWVCPAAMLVAAAVVAFPLIVFGLAAGSGRHEPAEAFRAAWQILSKTGPPTVTVALLAAACSAAIALIVMDEPDWPLPLRVAAGTAFALVMVTAVLPPPMIGTSLVAFYSNDMVSPRMHWNLYDNTPVAWVAAMVARFAFVPACLLRLVNRRLATVLSAQARTDGANRIQRLAHTHLPLIWRSWLAAAMVVGMLSLSEIAAAGLVQPPQWSRGSLAVYVDSEMHYGRNDHTVALSLMMTILSVLGAVLVLLVVGPPKVKSAAGGVEARS